MIYEFLVREPDKAYLDTFLWLPKTTVSLEALQSSLEIPVAGPGSQIEMLPLWRETQHHIGIPRESVPLEKIKCEVVNLIPEFPTVRFESNVILDYLDPERSDQRNAFADLVHSRGGILNLACGKGKTVLFLHAVSKWSTPAVVINDKGHILDQWKEEIEDKLSFDGDIGKIQGPPRKWTWENPIVLASLRSLAKYADEVPHEMRRHFGVAVWDEIHHLSAPMFSRSASVFPGKRFGATATPRRADGSQMVYFAHVGKIIHSNMRQDIIPKVVFIRSPTRVDMESREVRRAVETVAGDVHVGKLAAYVGTLEEELNFAANVIQEGIDDGRRILALSLSVDHLAALHERFPQSGLITQDTKTGERLQVIREKQLVLGTTNLAQEALNEKRLDSLVLLSEFSSDNMLLQSTGRIQRKLKEGTKKEARVVVIWHAHVPAMRSMGNKLRAHFRSWGWKIKEK